MIYAESFELIHIKYLNDLEIFNVIYELIYMKHLNDLCRKFRMIYA